MSRIIAVSNQKGGVGKTTTSVNLAACVAEKGKRVLLVDIDPQGNASSGLGVAERTPSVYDVLLGEESAGAAVRKTEFDNLSVLPSDMALAGASWWPSPSARRCCANRLRPYAISTITYSSTARRL